MKLISRFTFFISNNSSIVWCTHVKMNWHHLSGDTFYIKTLPRISLDGLNNIEIIKKKKFNVLFVFINLKTI